MTKDAADALLVELQELYKGTQALHWPDELRDVLRYARRHRKDSADAGFRKRKAVIRVELWEYVREQDKRETDREQSRAVEDATEAGVC